MNVDGVELRSAWRDVVPRAGARYSLIRAHDPWFVGCSADGAPALIRRVDNRVQDSVRALGAIRLRFLQDVELRLDGSTRRSNVAALECADPVLTETFVVLALDMIRTLGDGPCSTRDVQHQLARWRDLLTGTPPLTETDQIGLWGELEVLARLPDLGTGVDSWYGPQREQIDFGRNGLGLEVKTSRMRRMHHLRWLQAVYGDTSRETYIVSLHVTADASGSSLHDQASRLLRAVPDPYALREKLLAAGYRDADVAAYDGRWELVEEPAFFPMSAVPRFTEIPAGMQDVRWRVDLSSARPVPDKRVTELLQRFVERK